MLDRLQAVDDQAYNFRQVDQRQILVLCGNTYFIARRTGSIVVIVFECRVVYSTLYIHSFQSPLLLACSTQRKVQPLWIITSTEWKHAFVDPVA